MPSKTRKSMLPCWRSRRPVKRRKEALDEVQHVNCAFYGKACRARPHFMRRDFEGSGIVPKEIYLAGWP